MLAINLKSRLIHETAHTTDNKLILLHYNKSFKKDFCKKNTSHNDKCEHKEVQQSIYKVTKFI